MAETSDYPGALDSFIDFEPKRDVVSKQHINKVQNAIEAIQAELGTDPAGSVTDVKTRLYVSLGNDGALRKGTSFPASPIEGQPFWRTDEKVLYFYDATNTTWKSSQSYSSTLFQISANVENAAYEYIGNSLIPTAAPTANYRFFPTTSTSYVTIKSTKFTKLATVSTVTVYAQIWMSDNANGNEQVDLKVDIGGQNGSVSKLWSDGSALTPSWVSFTINVSSLTTGTVYDVVIQLKATGTVSQVYMGNLIAFGS